MWARWLGRFADPRRILIVCLAGLALAGCDKIPTLGPHIEEVVDESQVAGRYGFFLVNVDKSVLQAITAVPHGTLREFFPDDHPIVPRIGPGDVLSITIYESGAGELFAPPTVQQLTYGTTNVTLPALVVGPGGGFTVPFAGMIHAAGLTPNDVQTVIRKRLGGKAIQPQVQVIVVKDETNVVTVTGAVKNPGRLRITPASETLTQMIADSGGSTALATDTILQLTRHGRQVAVRLSDLLSFPQQDIHAWPGDYINLVQDPRKFLIYGAVYKAGTYPLPVDKVTLAEAVSSAYGLNDRLADSRGVFVFRNEFPQVLHSIPPKQIISAPPQDAATGPMVPVVYRIDMKTAAGIFFASSFLLRDNDLVYVPVAPTVDWEKILDLFRLTTSPVVQGTTSAIELNRGF